MKAFEMTMLIKDYPDYPLLGIRLGKEMSDEELFAFCTANENLRIERDEQKQIIIMPPSGLEAGGQGAEVQYAVHHWSKQIGFGKVFGSSGGYTLPDKSMRSPDVSLVPFKEWNDTPREQRRKFPPIVPLFIVEVMSPSDTLPETKEKMNKWINNGVKLGWLIAPEQELVLIYRADGTVDKVEGFGKTLSGEDVLPGFEFDLSVLL